ncbi:MAG TPA: helix-turn-helix domain-containing protein [Rubrobacter sp.]|nr:helix-turn-helix domain-containing protein [Rubrobacter sp.]
MDDGRQTLGPAEEKIGRVLERARKDRGLTLEEAERATKIRKRYLEGLEQDDYTVLPDAVYARGFLKTYANFLGLDGVALSQELRTRRKPRRERGVSYAAPSSEFERPIISPGGVPGSEKRKVSSSTIITVAVAALVIAALVGALYFVGLGVRSSGAGEAERIAAPVEPGNSGRGAEEAKGEEPSGALTVGVEVKGVPAWIRVRSDSETVFEEVAQPGFSRTFEARRAVGIRAGDAGAVSVEVNGQDVGTLGDPGQVLEKSYTLKSAS